jgi:hypothetical protein
VTARAEPAGPARKSSNAALDQATSAECRGTSGECRR